jgi:GT2 family glycosyltransferase
VIVPVHRGEECIQACLESVRAHAPDAEVLVVDDASPDGTAELVRARFPEVVLVECARNVGFGAACNLGAARASGDVLLFLNQDARLACSPARALERFAAESDLAVLGGLVRYPDGRLQPSHGRDPTPARVVAHWALYPLRAARVAAVGDLHARAPEAYARAGDVDWVSGSCCLVRRASFHDAGGFGPEFFMYVEDVDLCARLRARGGRVAFEPALVAVHAERGGAERGISALALTHTIAGQAVYLSRRSGRARTALALGALVPCFAALWLAGGAAARIAHSPRGSANARAFRAGAVQACRARASHARGGDGRARAAAAVEREEPA